MIPSSRSTSRSEPRRGVYRAYCFKCMCEWETDMVETEPGHWRAEDMEEAGDLQICHDCGSWLSEPESIEVTGAARSGAVECVRTTKSARRRANDPGHGHREDDSQ